ncbi:MAG: hypothetical protein Q4E17_03340 [Synergistes sp.]|nr:hypothetical protein [Synergistes sp.]
MKAILKVHALTILSVIAVIALALPFITVTTSVPFIGSRSDSMSGFNALGTSLFGVILIAGPILVAVMNYIKALAAHKGKIAIAIPIICILCVIYIIVQVNDVEIVSEYCKTSVGPGFGLILAFLSYAAMIVVGAVEYRGYKLNKAGVEKLKRQDAEAETISQKASDPDEE